MTADFGNDARFAGSWRLRARPPDTAAAGVPAGVSRLGLEPGRDGLVQVPTLAGADPIPLVVLLHGSGSNSGDVIDLLQRPAQEHGFALLAPDARGSTWDLVRGSFGPDVRFIDRALEHVMARLPIDPARVALAGFSDGASYALSLALGNGDLFTHLIAFSPGFSAPGGRVGAPRIFVSHGVYDPVLPIDRCSRRIVPSLRHAGYDVTYEEFEGGHQVPPRVAWQAADWLL
jgi:phospholipase/carboxylesterase